MSFPTFPRRAVLLCALAVLLVGLAFATAGSSRLAGAAATQGQPGMGKPAAPVPDGLDAIRFNALEGNADASAELARLLINRYETTGDRENLYEAFQWIEHDWDRPEFVRTGLVQRVVSRHCDGPVLRWHWLCIAGE